MRYSRQVSMTERRNSLIRDRIDKRLYRIHLAVEPVGPDQQHWLSSDAGPSYCYECAIVARGREFELGPLISPRDAYPYDEWHEAFHSGIDGGYPIESDGPVSCNICGETLDYSLTDSGLEGEIDHYRADPLASVTDEDAYALACLTECLCDTSPRHMILGVAIAINQAFRIISHGD